MQKLKGKQMNSLKSFRSVSENKNLSSEEDKDREL